MIVFSAGAFNAFSQQEQQLRAINYAPFFDYPLEEIKIRYGDSGWGEGEKLRLKKDSNTVLLNEIENCLKLFFADTNSLKTSTKTEINITPEDIDTFLVYNTYYYNQETGDTIQDVTDFMKEFKQKYLKLSEEQFQQVFKYTGSITYDGPYIENLLINSNKDTLIIDNDNSLSSPFLIPWTISYKQTYFEAKNLNLTNCLLPILNKVNRKYDINHQKENFLYYFIGAMFRVEKKKN